MSAQYLDPLTVTSPALSVSGGDYFLAYQNNVGNCVLLTCTSLAPPASCAAPSQYPQCTTVRAASQGGATLVATVSSVNHDAGAFLPSAPSTVATLGPSDDQAMLVLPASSGGFQVIWASAGTLMVAHVSATLVVTGLTTLATGLERQPSSTPSPPRRAMPWRSTV